MPKRKEEAPVEPEDRGAKFVRARLESDRLKYLAYWLTLSERDRERVPEPTWGATSCSMVTTS